MKQGLFESLTGKFYDGKSIDNVPESQRLQKTIIGNLTRIFNTRRGSLPHIKDYGLPDISELYHKTPEGLEELRSTIQKTIQIYEPRLKNIKVHPEDSKSNLSQLVFILTAELKTGEQLRLQTTFFTNEPSKIVPYKKTQ